MENYIDTLHKSKLFASVSKEEIENILGCLDASEVWFSKGDTVTLPSGTVGIIVDGNIQLHSSDGQQLYAYSQCDILCAEHVTVAMSLTATENCTVIILNEHKLLTVCSRSCLFHKTVIKNLFSIQASEITALMNRLHHITKRTTREKLISYFTQCAAESSSPVFEIACSRKQLAQYLCVDRSAMTTALYSLQEEGILKISRNEIELLNMNK